MLIFANLSPVGIFRDGIDASRSRTRELGKDARGIVAPHARRSGQLFLLFLLFLFLLFLCWMLE